MNIIEAARIHGHIFGQYANGLMIEVLNISGENYMVKLHATVGANYNINKSMWTDQPVLIEKPALQENTKVVAEYLECRDGNKVVRKFGTTKAILENKNGERN